MKQRVLIIIVMLLPICVSAQHYTTDKEELIKYYQGQHKSIKEKHLPKIRFGVNMWPDRRLSQMVCRKRHDYIVNESYGLDLSIDGLFDKDMRKRVVQLLKNEYEEGEFEKLVNRRISKIGDKNEYARHQINWYKLPKSLHKVYKDTSSVEFKAFADSCWNDKIESIKKDCKENYQFDVYRLLNTCRYLHDKKIAKQLIKMYNDTTLSEYHYSIQTVLISMKIEPFYSDCFKRNMFKDTIYDDDPDYAGDMFNNIDTLSQLIYSQESFLEISKFLLSNKKIHYDEIDDEGNISNGSRTVSSDMTEFRKEPSTEYVFYDAFVAITAIRNQDLWDLIGVFPWGEEEYFLNGVGDIVPFVYKNRQKMYDWMQANYGKYEIAPRW